MNWGKSFVTYPLLRGEALAHAVDIAKAAGFGALVQAVVPRACAVGSGFESLEPFDGSVLDGRGPRKGKSQGKGDEEGRQLHLG